MAMFFCQRRSLPPQSFGIARGPPVKPCASGAAINIPLLDLPVSLWVVPVGTSAQSPPGDLRSMPRWLASGRALKLSLVVFGRFPSGRCSLSPLWTFSQIVPGLARARGFRPESRPFVVTPHRRPDAALVFRFTNIFFAIRFGGGKKAAPIRLHPARRNPSHNREMLYNIAIWHPWGHL